MAATRALPSVMTTAQARAFGVARLLRDGSYIRAARGLWMVVGSDPADPGTRVLLAITAAPDDAVVGGWAAARVHERRRLGRSEVPQFDGAWGSPDAPEPVLLLVPPETRLVARPFHRVVRTPVAAAERERVDGIEVTTPLRTAFDLARLSPLPQAVAAIDRLRALRLVDPDQLAELLEERRHLTGAARGRRAVALSTDGVESRQESAMRLLWCEAGLRPPTANAVIRDARGGFVARVDVLDPDVGLVGEYDGAVHASAQQRSSDAARQQRLERLGLVVVRATAADLATRAARAEWCRLLRDAHRRAVPRASAGAWTAH